MASPAQFTANRQNAQSSTGPRSPEGKARVAQNAIKHGLTSKHLIIRPEDQDEFDDLQTSLYLELDPQGALETITFHDLIHAAWNLHRLRRMEVECDPADFAGAERISRYLSRTQRAYYRAVKELRTLQTNRALHARKILQDEAPSIPALANIPQFPKNTKLPVREIDAERARPKPAYDDRALRL
jgi:hypothetical protein